MTPKFPCGLRGTSAASEILWRGCRNTYPPKKEVTKRRLSRTHSARSFRFRECVCAGARACSPCKDLALPYCHVTSHGAASHSRWERMRVSHCLTNKPYYNHVNPSTRASTGPPSDPELGVAPRGHTEPPSQPGGSLGPPGLGDVIPWLPKCTSLARALLASFQVNRA